MERVQHITSHTVLPETKNMFHRFQGHAILTGLVLLAMPLCLPDVTRADDEADLRAAFGEGQTLDQKGDYPGAAKAYERALELAPQVFGSEDKDTAAILNNLANMYQKMGQYAKAEPLYQRSLKIKESKLGPDHLDVAWSLNNLAALYDAMAQYAKAEPLYQRSLKIRESKLGPDDPDVASSLDNLANLYNKMAQYAKAEPLYQRSLKIRESQLGPDHPDVAASLNNLAALYDAMAQYAKAEPLYQRSLKIRESQLGPDHPDVAMSLNNLAVLYVYMGQYAKAEPLYQRSLKIRESRLGPDHPDVAVSLQNLADLYSRMGEYAKAEPLYQRSLKIKESKLGPDHPDMASSLNNLAVLYKHMGQYNKAELLIQRSLTIRESRLGPDHPDVAYSLNDLADLYYKMGQYAKAELLYQRSLKIYESKLGPDHPNVVEYGLHSLALLHAATESWSKATAETERERRIVSRHVARTLPILSEKEQLTFLQTQDEERLHAALSLGLLRRADAQTALRSAGWVLNGKAVAQEVLAQRTILANAGTDPTLAELAKQLLAIRGRLASLSMSMPKPGQEAVRRQQLESLSHQEQELSRQLGQATGRDTNGDLWVEPAAVRKVMAKDAVLIEMARFGVWGYKEQKWLAPHYAAWLIPAEGQGKISIVDLGEAANIDTAVQQARKALEKADKTIGNEGEADAEKQLRDAMRNLTRMVFEPLEAHFGNARQLIVSPDAALWLVPWGAFPLPGGKYAIEKYQIRYCISGRDLVSQATKPGQKTTVPILFANPDYDLGPAQAEAATRAVLRGVTPEEQVASTRGVSSLSSLRKVGRLPGTAEEAKAIKPSVQHYAGVEPVLYQEQFALKGVFMAVHGPRVLFLGTHGFFMPDQEAAKKDDRASGLGGDDSRNRGAVLTTEGKPLENPLLRCGLLLAGCNQRAPEDTQSGGDDGILTGLEIVGTDLRGTELVVLSACETGLGQVRNGEGVAGLRQAFQLAGAKAVVSTLWQIPDRETVELMTAFFANLSAGQSKADALRNAQLAQIKARRANNAAAHPYYWAAFTLTGE